MKYKIVYTKQAEKDYQKVKRFSALFANVKKIINILKSNPFMPPYEKLAGIENTYSKRINIQHRLVYEVFEKENTIKVIRMWSHYE
ncbi:MAG: Txe/YoeB family addiction module toxin [Clostridiales bacterium]|jgi:Txe/YoeB family toxin of toxin-antitoxin system|nr:Txe/YoeB family addiction module toxin [Clostridiales bacterium]